MVLIVILYCRIFKKTTKYRKNNTSGLGVRALYRTMFPEISAQWSPLEPTFRYLLSDREGEKCWSLNHAWQIPFFHSAQFIISSNFYIYGTLVPSSIVSALKEKQWRWAKTFCYLWKPSHFPNMKRFLQPFFAQNKPEMSSESINQLRLHGSQKEQNLHNIIK